MTDEKMRERRLVVLEDGRQLHVNLNNLTWRQVRELMSGPQAGEEEEREEREWRFAGLIGQTVGLSADEMLELGFLDFSRIERKVIEFMRDPVGVDPN